MKSVRITIGSALLLAVLGLSLTGRNGQASGEYSFSVHNSTETAIIEILVSEDQANWGRFNIGKGIRSGETVKLVWDQSTNNQGCHQFVKAVFGDDSESEAADFNFCENDLELEF